MTAWITRFAAFCLAALLLAGVPARAMPLGAQERAEISRINDYLNGISNFSGHFLQIGPDGRLAEGEFNLSRPGYARFDYDTEDLIVVARGQRLMVKEGNFVTNELPLDGTPLKVLLGEQVDLARDADITNFEQRQGTLAVSIRDPEAAELGEVTLIFDAPQVALRQWIVTDAQGLSTTVSLSDVTHPEHIDRSLFNVESSSPVLRGRQD